jgi:uncharacterized protein (TIGR03437 family)
MRKTCICVLGIAVVLSWSTPVQAQSIFGTNLVVNGDAETGLGTPSSAPPASIPGWSISGSPSVELYSGSDRLSNTSPGPSNRGKNYFAGSSTQKASLVQTIDVSSAAVLIDSGTVSYDASGYLGGSSGDTSSMTVTFLSATATLGSFTLGPLTDTDKGQSDAIYLRRKIGPLPPETRSVTVEVDLLRSSGTNNDGAADNISLILNNIAAVPSGFYGSNLIQNGNAEAPNGVDLLNIGQYTGFALDIPNWVRSAYFSLDAYPHNVDLAPTDPGPPDRGSWYFYGGPSNATSNAYQDLDLSAAGSQIDAGQVSFRFSGWIGGISSQNDNMTVTAQFMDWSGAPLSNATLGPVLAAERNNLSSLIQKSVSGAVPHGARMVRVTMTANRTDGSDDDGLADSLSLVLTGPSAGGPPPSIQSGGVVTASAFGGFPNIAPGTWVEIYGVNLAGSSREWAGTDFQGTTAPITLDGTSVTIGGAQAFVRFISPTQVNAQIPSGVAPGPQQMTVTTSIGTSAAYPVTVNATQPGFLAPTSFLIGGKQYLAALHADGSFVLPTGALPGFSTIQAKPGEIIILYGIGFGPVSPAINAGQVVAAANQLVQPFTIQFAQAGATVLYDGLAPNFVGLYQFNVVVPNVSDNDLTPITFTLGGAQGSQTLYTAVKH